jgi:hypothetical protein
MELSDVRSPTNQMWRGLTIIRLGKEDTWLHNPSRWQQPPTADTLRDEN